MSCHVNFAYKVNARSLLSTVAATLLVFSSTALAARTGPACTLPASDGLTATQWAAAQDAATTRGHLVACHIGKDATWLKERPRAKKRPNAPGSLSPPPGLRRMPCGMLSAAISPRSVTLLKTAK